MFHDYRKQDLYSKVYVSSSLAREKGDESKYLLGKLDSFLREKKKILDVGCGAGILGSEIRKKYGGVVCGLDINRLAVKNAAKLGLKTQIADIEKKWPFQDNSFDLVIMVQIIEHVLNTDHLVLEARRVLRKGGLLIVTTPNLASWFNRLIFLFGFQPFFTEVSLKDKTLGLKFTRQMTKNRETVGHIRIFTLRALLDFLKYYEFKIRSVKGGSLYYLPLFMKPLDNLFSKFPSLAADSIVIAVKQK